MDCPTFSGVRLRDDASHIAILSFSVTDTAPGGDMPRDRQFVARSSCSRRRPTGWPAAADRIHGATNRRDDALYRRSWLTRDSRQREEDCETTLRELRIRAGMTVVDMGCGNGFYSLPMAKLTGDRGRVLAVDIQPEMLRLLEARAKDEGRENIRTIQGTPIDPRLPENAVDLILCVDVYHEFSHPEQMLAAMRKALKPEGQLVLAEFREEDPAVPIKPLHKMSKRQVLKELVPNGFRLVREFDELPWQHLMFFGRDKDAAGLGETVPTGEMAPAPLADTKSLE